MTYKVIANIDLEARPHSWTKGLDYEVTEKQDYFTLTSNEGQVNYMNTVKTDILINFNPSKEEEAPYFYPYICCASCAKTTKDWKWVKNPNDSEVYGVCEKCEGKVKKDGIKLFYPT